MLAAGAIVGAQVKQAREPAVAAAEMAVVESAKREVADSQVRDTKLREDVRSLRAEIVASRANADQLRQAEMQKQAGEVRALRAMLEAHKSETASLKADLVATRERLDKDKDHAQRLDKTVERVDRLEKRIADANPTGTTVAKATPDAAKPDKPPVKGIVLRDAQRGVALVETRRGMIEVMRGDVIPGAGRVEAIEKHDGRWRVVTTTGIIDDRLE